MGGSPVKEKGEEMKRFAHIIQASHPAESRQCTSWPLSKEPFGTRGSTTASPPRRE